MSSKMNQKEFENALRSARKDPQFHRDIQQFIKITTGSYKLKDYGLD